jgi:hypothetical protein
LPRYQSGLQNLAYLRWSGRCEFLLHPIPTLQDISMCIVSCIVEFGCAPTVMGLIRTPSSIWAFVASSASFPWRTFFPHKVFTNVVRPEIMCQLPSRFPSTRSDIPVPEAPQTIKQNWIPFLTFFFLRILICKSYGQYRHINMSMCKISNPSMVLPGNAGSESSKGVDDDRPKDQHTALKGEDMMATIAW